MGLDIEAGRRARRIADVDDERDFDRNTLRLWVNGHFEHGGEARAGSVRDGVYECEGRLRFRAGSYSGYNRWREQLCRLVHGVEPEVVWHAPDEYRGSAFYEIIHFSDCEGCIGPEVARKLVADFAEWRDRAREVFDEYEFEVYDAFARAFALAADDGAVQFC